MPLYRCLCKPFNPKLNNNRKIVIKKIINIVNNKLFKNENILFNNINIFLVDSGGLLDEFKIISKIKFKKNSILNFYIIELNLKNNKILFAQNIFFEKITKIFKNHILNFKIINSFFFIENLLKKYGENFYNIFISIDPLIENIKILNDKNDFINFLFCFYEKISLSDCVFDYFSMFSLQQESRQDLSLNSDYLPHSSFHKDAAHQFFFHLFSYSQISPLNSKLANDLPVNLIQFFHLKLYQLETGNHLSNFFFQYASYFFLKNPRVQVLLDLNLKELFDCSGLLNLELIDYFHENSHLLNFFQEKNFEYNLNAFLLQNSMKKESHLDTNNHFLFYLMNFHLKEHSNN